MKNRIRIVFLSAFLSAFLSCKNKNSEYNKDMSMKMNEHEFKSESNDYSKEGYSIVYVPGDSVENLDKTLKSIQNMKLAYANFLNDSNDEQDGDLIAEISDMKIASELISLALRQKGLKQLHNNEIHNELKTVLKMDLDQVDNCMLWKVEEGIMFFSDNPDYSLDVFVPSIWNKKYSSIDIQNNIIYFNKFFYFYNSDSDLDDIYDQTNNLFKIKIWHKDLHRNLFLFNFNQQSMVWLIHNDASFLDYMVKNYGYTREKLINGLVLNLLSVKYRNNDEIEKDVLVDYFAKKYCNEVEIREKLMQYIVKSTTVEDNDLLLLLDDYAADLVDFDNSYTSDLRDGFTKDEVYKIFAYAAYYSYLGFDQHDKGLGRFSSLRENWPNFCALTSVGLNEDVQEALKKNNYYNLKGLREAMERIEAISRSSSSSSSSD